MKTRNIILSSLVGIALLFSATSCDDGFEAINKNPNGILDNKHPFYITDIAQSILYGCDYNYEMKGGGSAGGASLHQRVKAIGLDTWAQYTMGNRVTGTYSSNDAYQSTYWGAHFISYLASLNKSIPVADAGGDVNATAIALTWRAHMQALATDYFGPIPFPTEPTAGIVPPYMELKDQYKIIFEDLEKAANLFDPTKEILKNEPLYNGDVAKWKKFNNTLRIRLAIKMSEIDPELCKTQIKAALKSEYGGVINSLTGEAAAAPYGSWGSINSVYSYYYGWGMFGGKTIMTKTMEKILVGIGGKPYNGTATIHPLVVDPRGSEMFDPCPSNIELGIVPTWQGGNVGNDPEATNYRESMAQMNLENLSQNVKRKLKIMMYSEACFLLAEAVERGFVSAGEGGGSADYWYNRGVDASFQEWGLTSADATAYLDSEAKNDWGTSAKYSHIEGAGNTKLEKIVTQRYIAFFPDLSNNIWNDKRRLNLPAMQIPQHRNTGDGTWPNDNDIKNPKNYIQRSLFPQNEAQVNKQYYDEAVQMLGGHGDKNSTPLWWASKGVNYCTSN